MGLVRTVHRQRLHHRCADRDNRYRYSGNYRCDCRVSFRYLSRKRPPKLQIYSPQFQKSIWWPSHFWLAWLIYFLTGDIKCLLLRSKLITWSSAYSPNACYFPPNLECLDETLTRGAKTGNESLTASDSLATQVANHDPPCITHMFSWQ